MLLKALEHVEADIPREADDVRGAHSSRRAQALIMLAERSLAATDVSASSADRFQIGVHMSVDEAAEGNAPGLTKLDHGPVLSRASAERLLCDASIVTYEADAAGNPLNVGRKTRVISPSLRRALRKRDGGCRFPGCPQHRFVDAHHIQHWAHGGETKMGNLVLLCRHHHRLIHEAGFRASCSNGVVQFRKPDGELLPDVVDPVAAGNVLKFPPDVSAESLVGPRSLTPGLDHRRPDYGHICWVLTQHWEPFAPD